MVDPSIAAFLSGPFGRVAAGVWGALWASFFNVMIVRVPHGESLVRPPSHCRSCRAPVRWYDNIPIVSYLLLRGRCRHCGARYSIRYLLIEILIALLAVAMHQVFFVDSSAELALRAGRLAITSLFCGLLVAIAMIDVDTLRIPNVITYPGIPVATALSVFMGHPHLWDGAVGAVAGYLIIRVIADGYELMTGRRGMGYGDAKLLALIGGLLGWQVLLPTLFLGALQGSVIGIGVLVLARSRARAVTDVAEREDDPAAAAAAEAVGPGEQADPSAGDAAGPVTDERPATPAAASGPRPTGSSLMRAQLPFGPFLALAAIELMILHHSLPLLMPYMY